MLHSWLPVGSDFLLPIKIFNHLKPIPQHKSTWCERNPKNVIGSLIFSAIASQPDIETILSSLKFLVLRRKACNGPIHLSLIIL